MLDIVKSNVKQVRAESDDLTICYRVCFKFVLSYLLERNLQTGTNTN